MAKNQVSIKIKSDTKEAEQGLNKVTAKLNKFNKEVKSSDSSKFVNSVKSMKSAVGGYAAIVAAVLKVLQSYFKGIGNVAEAYKVQENAEKSLEIAARNNPYLAEDSVRRLKEFAGEMQKISNYGDEQIIALETQLAATGRTEDEIKKIIKASADMASATGQDIKTVAMQLNSSYSGMAGTIGRQIKEVKNLTKEELEHGKAVDIVAEKYKGLASSMTDAKTQAQNAKGDLKEAWGALTKPTVDKFYEIKTKQYENLNKLLTTTLEEINKINLKTNLKSYIEDINRKWADKNGNIIATGAKEETTEFLQMLEKELESRKKLTSEQKEALIYIKDELRFRKQLATEEQREIEARKKIASYSQKELAELYKAVEKNDENRLEKEKLNDSYHKNAIKERYEEERKNSEKTYKEIIEKRDEAIKKINLEAEALGKEVDLQDVLNAELTAYIELCKNPFLEDFAEKQKKVVQDIAKQLKPTEETIDALKLLEEEIDSLLTKQQKTEVQQLREKNDQLLKLQKEYSDAVVENKEEQAERLKAIEEEIALNNAKIMQKQMETVNFYASNISDVMTQLSSMLQTTAENEAIARNAALEKEYNKGLMSEEEYQKKKEQIEKESAKESYKAQMWAWTAQVAQIGASTATAIMQVLADPMIVSTTQKVAMSAMMGVLGAAQLASAIASKPLPPAFATGGIVPGNSYSGDKVIARVNSGEGIFTADQMKAMGASLNGNGNSKGLNVQIQNYRGNDTSVTPQITEDGLRVIVRKIVNDDIASGKHNTSLMQAQNSFSGSQWSS